MDAVEGADSEQSNKEVYSYFDDIQFIDYVYYWMGFAAGNLVAPAEIKCCVIVAYQRCPNPGNSQDTKKQARKQD